MPLALDSLFQNAFKKLIILNHKTIEIIVIIDRRFKKWLYSATLFYIS